MGTGDNVSAVSVRTGDKINDRYVCERVLGEGGMGIVLSAADDLLRRRVAIKIVRPELAEDEACRERLLREARAAAKLKSAHTARVIDIGTTDRHLPFIVFEYLEGRDLGEILAENGPLPLATAVDYVLEGCDALREAHALGIIHRDLKPANFFLAEDGYGGRKVKLLDFGIAKAVDEHSVSALTRPDSLVGSPSYMAPEQLRGFPTDARTDIWAMGVVLYELVTGAPAFDGEGPADVWASILTNPPRPIFERQEAVPSGIDTVIRRCLALDPRDRYANVDELVEALSPYATPHPVDSEPGPLPRARSSYAKRHGSPLLVIAITAAMAMASAVADATLRPSSPSSSMAMGSATVARRRVLPTPSMTERAREVPASAATIQAFPRVDVPQAFTRMEAPRVMTARRSPERAQTTVHTRKRSALMVPRRANPYDPTNFGGRF